MSKCNQDDGHEEVRNDMDCPCEPFLQGSVDIIIEEQLEDGSPNLNKNSRYVKICGSIEDCRVYPIIIDDTTGMGTLHLDDIVSVKNVVVLVDENGQQIINGDSVEISYYIDEEEVENGYATITMSNQGQEHHEVRIVNRRRKMSCLEIYKVLRDTFMEPLDFQDGMCFTLHLCGMGIEETIVLDHHNDFHVHVEHLYPGTYTLREDEVCDYGAFFRFDGGEECECANFELTRGEHELQVINQRMSQSVLTIDKYIRDDRGELIKPQEDECFEIRLISDTFDAIYTLNCENDFSLELLGLKPGFYVVNELTSDYQVTYLVNHQMETDHAHVEIRPCEASSVMIINTPMGCCACTSPLRICKFMRRCDGALVRPSEDACFKVMLCGCGFYQTFNLNACNNFCVDIDNICCGEYEIREIDNECFKTSYIVNDGCERTCAFLCLHEQDCNVVNIINEERNKGSVSICKFIRNQQGDLVKPMKDARFLVTLRSFFCFETFVLDEQNDWCVYFDHLREGSYEVRERSCEGYDITYIVNGCKEQKRARFTVDSDCTNEIRIVNTVSQEDCGTLRVCKLMELKNGERVKPSIDETFEFQLNGPCIKETYTLHSHNNWCVLLEGLTSGEYRICETCDNGYDQKYLVNGCLKEDAVVCMGNGNQDVCIINSYPRGGNLEISAWIRNCQDEIMKPCGNASFEIFVEHHSETRCYTLDARNRWSILLDDLTPGKYRVIQKDNYGYEVSYEIDHEESAHGVVELDGDDQSIRIINSISQCQGMVYIEKSIVDACGNKGKPCPSDSFDFCLRATGFQTTFTLDETNDFCVYFDDLREGKYCLEEINDAYEPSFIINEEERKDGSFVLGREDIQIEVWNNKKPEPIVCIAKRIRKQGRLCMPDPCECYEFVICGKDVHEVYTLDVSNDFMICLSELCHQHYEIKELHVEGCVSYLVDDCLQGDGYFLFDGEDKNITIINEEGCDDRVHICKVMEENHQTCKPFRWESFTIQLEGRNYKEQFTLNCDNDWGLDLAYLDPGNYEIKELGEYETSFNINGENSDHGCFFIGQGDVDITIINHPRCQGSFQIAAYDCDHDNRRMPHIGAYDFTLAMADWQQTYTLCSENDWSLCFDELPAGDYTLSSCDENVCFEMMDDIAEVLSFHLECECKTAALLVMPKIKKHCLAIDKKMRDECQRVLMPENASFEVEISSEDGTQTICLNEENQYCIRLELSEGTVTVKESSEEALYQFNGGPLHEQAIFPLCKDSTLTIFNPFENSQDVCVHGQVENCKGEHHSPQKNDCFQVTLTGNEVCETKVLNRKNGWCVCFENVPSGCYEITSTLEGYEKMTISKEECHCGNQIVVEKEELDYQLIYHEPCPHGSLEILKYKKDNNCGCFVRPCQRECYEIRVWSDTMEEIITLDAGNSWRQHLMHLKEGMYHVEELHGEDEVSYIVNGGEEKEYGEVMIDEDAAYVKVINTKHSEALGSIEISKYIKDACQMRRPQPTSSYTIIVKGPQEDQIFYLNEANDFCVKVQSLEEGTYEVLEQTSDDVCYIVNNGCEMKRAIVHVMQNHNRVQVINQPMLAGRILLSKFVKDEMGKLQVPEDNEMYRIHVSKPNFNQVVMLSKENHFKEQLDNLDNGWYVIDELNHEGVTYRINGGSEVDSGAVQVRNDEQEVWVINSKEVRGGSLTIAKMMRMDQQYQKPSPSDSFQFHISRPGFNQVYTLNKENDWTQKIDHLQAGSYVIQEIDNPFEVSYIINGASETNFGIVNIQNNENTVFIINTATEVTGSIQITKYMRHADGQLVVPTDDFAAQVHVSRPGFNQIYDLTLANQWTIKITGLADGQYVVDEVDATDEVTYIINGGSEVHRAIVRVSQNQNQVMMINQMMEMKGSITVTKYIQNNDGQLVRPTGDFSAMLHVSRPGFNQFYDLNASNQWMMTISNLEDGQYVLDEADATQDVTYRINGGSEVYHGIVRVQGNANQVMMINHDVGETILNLQKFRKPEKGELLRPYRGEEFQIHVSSPTYEKIILLNDENDFQMSLHDVSEGLYTIEEIGNENEHTTYRINGQDEMEEAVLEIMKGSTNDVGIINIRNASSNTLEVFKYIVDENGNFIKPSVEESFQIQIYNNQYQKEVILDETNRWHMMSQNLPNGTFTLEEVSNQGYQVAYMVNGKESDSNAKFTVIEGSHNVVEVLNKKEMMDGTLEITKRIRSSSGELILPSGDQVFEIRLYNDQGYTQTITLNTQNNFNQRVMGLRQGSYKVEELGNADYDVTYRINNGTETTDSNVQVMGEDIQMMIINTRTTMFYDLKEDHHLKIIIA